MATSRARLDATTTLSPSTVDPADRLQLEQRGGEAPGGRRAHQHPAGPVCHRVTDGVDGRLPPPACLAQQDDLALGQALHLVQDVRAHDHGAAVGSQMAEQGDEVGPLHGVGAVERLVEDEHGRVGHECGGDLRPLAHALAEAADPPIRHVEQSYGVQAAIDRGAIRHPVQAARRSGRAGGQSAPQVRPRPPARAPATAGPSGRGEGRARAPERCPCSGPAGPSWPA